MDSVFEIPASPGTPLFPVSPERANRRQLLQSPSMPNDLSGITADQLIPRHSRQSSDVQGKVAQFNNLSKEATQRRKDNEAALIRAVVGREEAESETRRLKEETRALRKEIEESRIRERRVGERMEAMMEEMQRLKDTHSHSKTLYEKEVRRARKEAFKSSSALVNLQEELKTTRNRFTLMREEVEAQKRKVELREQETFAAQYQLVGLQEELEQQKGQVKVVEEEREMLKTSLKEEELARIAAQEKISLPRQIKNDEFSCPRKQKTPIRRDSAKENFGPSLMEDCEELDDVSRLKHELQTEKTQRVEVEALVHFMKMECQFKICSCRRAEKDGKTFIHDNRFDAKMKEIAKGMYPNKKKTPTDPITIPALPEKIEMEVKHSPDNHGDTEPLIEFSPTTGTFRTIPSPSHIPLTVSPRPPSQLLSTELATLAVPLEPTVLSESPSLLSLNESTTKADAAPTSPTHAPPPASSPTTPRPLPLRPVLGASTTRGPSRIISHTVTTTIPLADPFTPARDNHSETRYTPAKDLPFSPGASITREQALEQIRQRRGRARSIAAGNGTPRNTMVDVRTLRRDISAPAGGAGGV